MAGEIFVPYDWVSYMVKYIEVGSEVDPIVENIKHAARLISTGTAYDDFKKVLCHLRYEYYNVDREQSKTEIDNLQATDNMQIFIREIETCNVWDEFLYVVYTSNIKHSLVHKGLINRTVLMRKIMTSLFSKETALSGMDLYKAAASLLGDHVECMSRILEYALCNEAETEESILFYNIITYFIPITKRWLNKVDEMERGFDCEDNKFNDCLNIVINKELRYENVFGVERFYISNNRETRRILVQYICRVQRKNHHVPTTDIDFVVNYMKQYYLCKDLMEDLHYLMSHLVVHANLMKDVLECTELFEYFYQLSKMLIYSNEEHEVKLGICIYTTVYKTAYLGDLKLQYTLYDKYSAGEGPFYKHLLQNQKWNFAELPDLKIFHSMLNTKNMVLFLELFQYTPNIKNVIPRKTWVDLCFIDIDQHCYAIGEASPLIIKLIMSVYLESDSDRNLFLLDLIQMTENTLPEVPNGKYPPVLQLYPMYRLLTEAVKLFIANATTTTKSAIKECWLATMEQLKTIISSYGMDRLFACKVLEKVIEAGIEFYFEAAKTTAQTFADVDYILCSTRDFLFCNIRVVTAIIEKLLGPFINRFAAKGMDLMEQHMRARIEAILVCDQYTSRLRQATEFKVFVHAVCANVPKEFKAMFIEIVFKEFLNLDEESTPSSTAIRMNCIAKMVADPSLKEYTRKYFMQLMMYCLLGMAESKYVVYNAACILFDQLLIRLLPSKNKLRNMTMYELSCLYPEIYNMHRMLTTSLNNPHLTSSKLLYMQILRRCNTSLPLSNDKAIRSVFERTTSLIMNVQSAEAIQALNLLIELFPSCSLPSYTLNMFTDYLHSDSAIRCSTKESFLYVLAAMLERYADSLHADMIKQDMHYENIEDMELYIENILENRAMYPTTYNGLLLIREQVTKLNNIEEYYHFQIKYGNPEKNIVILQKCYKEQHISAGAKFAAIEEMLPYFEKDRESMQFPDYLMLSIKIILSTHSTTGLKDLLAALGYLLTTTSYKVYDEAFLQIPISELMERARDCATYLLFYTQVIAKIPNVRDKISIELDRAILNAFWKSNRHDATFAFKYLIKITNCRPTLLAMAVGFLTYTEADSTLMCRSLLREVNIAPQKCTFDEIMSVIFSQSFIMLFFERCNNNTMEFLHTTQQNLAEVSQVLSEEKLEPNYKVRVLIKAMFYYKERIGFGIDY